MKGTSHIQPRRKYTPPQNASAISGEKLAHWIEVIVATRQPRQLLEEDLVQPGLEPMDLEHRLERFHRIREAVGGQHFERVERHLS